MFFFFDCINGSLFFLDFGLGYVGFSDQLREFLVLLTVCWNWLVI
jgi:hypothetical protein